MEEITTAVTRQEISLDDPGHDKDDIQKNEFSNKLTRIEDIEVKFAQTADKIKEELCNHSADINLASVIEQLRAVSAVKDKKVPLFAEDTFKTVSNIRILWQVLSAFWSIYDYDILKLVLEIIKCDKANKIFEDFLNKIDSSVIDDVDLIVYFMIYERKGFTKPLLRVKIKMDKTVKLSHHDKEVVTKALSEMFKLEEYALRLKGIKEGCVELLYEISQELRSYLMTYKLSETSLHALAACGIQSIIIDDLVIQISTNVDSKAVTDELTRMPTYIRYRPSGHYITHSSATFAPECVILFRGIVAGGLGGIVAGAAICSVVPGIGTMIGGVLGGLIGGVGGLGIARMINHRKQK